jgi:hypothetical protein
MNLNHRNLSSKRYAVEVLTFSFSSGNTDVRLSLQFPLKKKINKCYKNLFVPCSKHTVPGL